MASRLQSVRRQVRTARFAIVAASLAAFGGLLGAARASHAARHSGSRSLEPPSAFAQESEDDFGFGSGSIAPAGNASPTMQSGSS